MKTFWGLQSYEKFIAYISFSQEVTGGCTKNRMNEKGGRPTALLKGTPTSTTGRGNPRRGQRAAQLGVEGTGHEVPRGPGLMLQEPASRTERILGAPQSLRADSTTAAGAAATQVINTQETQQSKRKAVVLTLGERELWWRGKAALERCGAP